MVLSQAMFAGGAIACVAVSLHSKHHHTFMLEVFFNAWDPNIDCSVAPGVKGPIVLSQAWVTGSTTAGVPVMLRKKHPRCTFID